MIMKAVKANKIYTVDEISKAAYLAQGFDITDDEGNILEHSPSGAVSYAEYEQLLRENTALKAEVKKKKGEV